MRGAHQGVHGVVVHERQAHIQSREVAAEQVHDVLGGPVRRIVLVDRTLGHRREGGHAPVLIGGARVDHDDRDVAQRRLVRRGARGAERCGRSVDAYHDRARGTLAVPPDQDHGAASVRGEVPRDRAEPRVPRQGGRAQD